MLPDAHLYPGRAACWPGDRAGGISTSNDSLAQVWNDQIAGLPHAHPIGANDAVWEKQVIAILAKHGFRGDPAE